MRLADETSSHAEAAFLNVTEAQMRRTTSAKWVQYPADVLPAFVAEMDFGIPPATKRVLDQMVELHDFGYPMRGDTADDRLAMAFVRRMQNRFGWTVDPRRVLAIADLVQAIYLLQLVYAERGDGIVVQAPCYPPFRKAVEVTDRIFLALELVDDGARYSNDFAALETQITDRTKVLMLCNPQNPTGRVFERSELMALGELALAHDLIVVADEIHSDIIYDGQHIPFASLDPRFAERTITLNSATKSFNFPGLRCGIVYFGSNDLQARFHALFPLKTLGQVSIVGYEATIAAWTGGDPWLDAVMAQLKRNKQRILQVLGEHVPGIVMRDPEATYLGWLDCTGLDLGESAFSFFLREAKVAFSAGEDFDPACSNFVRFNFGTSSTIIEDILTRMVDAVRRRMAVQ